MADKELNGGGIEVESEKALSRGALLEISSSIITELQQKATSGRFRSPDNERMRDAKTRLLIQAIGVYGGLLRDVELSEIKSRLDAIEIAQERKK